MAARVPRAPDGDKRRGASHARAQGARPELPPRHRCAASGLPFGKPGSLGHDRGMSQRGERLPELVAIMQKLLAPDGCPWDREQTLESLRPYVIEEAHEVVDAIDRKDLSDLRDELGDLLLQIVFQSEIQEGFGI